MQIHAHQRATVLPQYTAHPAQKSDRVLRFQITDGRSRIEHHAFALGQAIDKRPAAVEICAHRVNGQPGILAAKFKGGIVQVLRRDIDRYIGRWLQGVQQQARFLTVATAGLDEYAAGLTVGADLRAVLLQDLEFCARWIVFG